MFPVSEILIKSASSRINHLSFEKFYMIMLLSWYQASIIYFLMFL